MFAGFVPGWSACHGRRSIGQDELVVRSDATARNSAFAGIVGAAIFGLLLNTTRDRYLLIRSRDEEMRSGCCAAPCPDVATPNAKIQARQMPPEIMLFIFLPHFLTGPLLKPPRSRQAHCFEADTL